MKWNFLILLTLLMLSCSSDLPKNVLEKEKMENILWDVAKGGEFVNGFVYFKYPTINRAAVNDQMLEAILKVHKVSKEQFNKSLSYYQGKPATLMLMFDSLQARRSRELKDTGSVSIPMTIEPKVEPTPIRPGRGGTVRPKKPEKVPDL